MERGILAAFKALPSVRRVALALAASGLTVALPSAGHATYGTALYSVTAIANGTIQSSIGVASVAVQAAGTYVVTFNRPVNVSCRFQSTVVGVNPGYSTTWFKAGSATALVVRTFSKTGVLASQAFTLVVTCGP